MLHTDADTAPAPPPRVGELELPPARGADRQADGDLPHEPPADARGRARVLRDAQPHRRDRPRQDHPHDPVRAPGLHRRTARPRRRATREISGHDRTHYCGAYWGWGFHEDGVVSGERVARAARSEAAVSAERDLRGHDPPPPLRGAPARVPLPDRDGLHRPRRAARPARRAASSRSRPGLVRFRRSDYLGDPAMPLADAVRALVEERLGTRARRARSACSPTCARSATASTR